VARTGSRPAPVNPTGPVGSGRVEVDNRSKVPIRLVRNGATVHAPTAVAPGTWALEADFGSGFVPEGTLLVESGQRYEVWCKMLTRECEIR
jgi:hypothetical protein